MPLTQLIQEDFSAGMVTAVAAHLVPATGLTEVINSLLDDDGSLYRRGGSQYKSGAAFGSGGLRWMWDGVLLAGRRTLVANSASFGVLAANDSTVVTLGGSGLSAPVRAWQFRDMLVIDGGTVYGGSRKAADYATGTLSMTQGSASVAATGTLFSANVDAGMLLRIGGAGRFYVVQSVDSDTGLTLTEPYEGSTAAGLTYMLTRLGTLSTPYRASQMYALVGKRLVALDADRIYEAEWNNPDTWDATAFHDLPGVGKILGAEPVRNTLLVFSTTGVWAISNMELELTDFSGGVQQSLAQVSGDLFLWGSAGISSWKGTPIVPALDGVWMFDGISEPQLLSRSIAPTYRAYVRAGYEPGRATVFQGHYFLPILNAGLVVDLLVCRLDRPTDSPIGSIFPWTRMRGHGGEVAAVTIRAEESVAPALLAAGQDGRVLDLTSFFVPSAAVKLDADGTAPTWRVETRDFATSSRRNRNHVRRLKAQYESRDAGTDDPQLTGYYSVGSDVADLTTWGAFLWGEASWSDASLGLWTQLSGTAPEDDGRTPYTWNLATFTRLIRARLESSEPTANLVLRSLSWAVREQGGDR